MSAAPAAVVVGAGPSGLVAAGLLARAGFAVRVLERTATQREGTRAPTLWPRAMNVLDLLGCGDRVRAAAHRVAQLGFVGDSGRGSVDLEDLACWTLPQYRLEGLLEERARELGVVVSRRTEVTGLDRSAPGAVSVRLASGDRAAADVLIAADGARSLVREELGVPFTGHEYESRFGLVDFVDEAGEHPRDSVETYTGSAGTLVSVPLPEGVIRLVAPLLERPDSDSDQVIRERLRGYGFGTEFGTVRWRSVFHVSVKMAERFAVAGAALVGDAAHVQSPAGGRGMNNAIEDAMSVATRLVVASGTSGADWAEALAGYEFERYAAIEGELGLIRRRTDRWVGADSSESESGPEPEGIPAGVSENRHAAMRAAGIPPAADEVTGREIRWADVDATFGTPLLVVVGDAELPEVLPESAHPRWSRELRVVGRAEPVPAGVYVVRPDGVVVARWSGEVSPAELAAEYERAAAYGGEHAPVSRPA
ncbi:hypothetical protein CDG81_12735 [Actinopolyspora erythraea]|uniref:FAD-binding domain-containing protein n=1 Tax=Actinopolyspora erythraea TaxID=414996 RepID=A0A099D5C1_9ACTN|nr:FAD-dependent monooxygenase [Actinopolyspora erythraea]ASU79010.1 hypothetical protein CDG81_12735 [Actinopolyspora erythraea]KGI81136.1 hypothetical protein IL38_12820 [Actinopolyspora erythraea]